MLKRVLRWTKCSFLLLLYLNLQDPKKVSHWTWLSERSVDTTSVYSGVTFTRLSASVSFKLLLRELYAPYMLCLEIRIKSIRPTKGADHYFFIMPPNALDLAQQCMCNESNAKIVQVSEMKLVWNFNIRKAVKVQV